MAAVLAAAGAWWLAALPGATPGGPGGLPAALPLGLPLALAAVPIAMAATRRRRAARPAAHPVALVAAPVAAIALAVGQRLLGVLTGAGAAPPVGLLRDVLLALVVLVPLTLVLAGAGRLLPSMSRRRTARARRVLVVCTATLAMVSASALMTAAAPATASPQDDAGAAAKCLDTAQPGAADKTFAVTALDLDIPINRFGQHDPAGKMYALNGAIPAIRAEERSRAVSIGLRDDVIQPLVIRANQGECVQIDYTNSAGGGDFGVHIDGLEFSSASSGDSLGNNPSSAVKKGSSRSYRFYIPNDRREEGAHYLHPGPGYRGAVSHGLFGALVVEPPGSRYLDANTKGQALESGWEAIIAPAGGKAFRESALLHHEIGNDNEKIKESNGQDVPQVDDTTGSYRPGAFALNYRSEPFRNRLLAFPKEKSHAYSSYTFGEPATPMIRGYLADPTKIRLVHAGGEKFHIYHLHGGGDRWRYNPVADTTYDYADTGLRKDPPTTLSPSQRLDSQSIGPGESYNLEIEGGAGGVQQAAGDFLFHCHIAKHYVSGMWSFWRVYDTLQPDFVPLPDRAAPLAGVDSTKLIGKTFNGTKITTSNLEAWVRPQLPPSGIPKDGQDPTVMDWKIGGTPASPAYLGAPADPTNFADSVKVVPGQPNLLPVDVGNVVENRPKILFDPTNGRPAYPLFRTHIGQRPPFTPAGHSGTPWLGQDAGQPAPAQAATDPWANRNDGLCPQNRKLRTYNVVAVPLAVQRSPGVTDPEGKLFTLAHDKADLLAGKRATDPLAIRANQGDCIAVTLTNEIPDKDTFDGVSKTTMHIHHVQFDPQGSDGVSAGFAFEHSVRPYTAYDPTLAASVAAGATTISLTDVSKFVGTDANGKPTQPFIAVGEGTEGIDVVQVKSVDPASKSITLTAGLKNAHPLGESAGSEFIQYRWYPDVQLDNIFWHDHVDGIHGWGHGLVGQLIVEPAGSTYHDPSTGKEVDSGTLVDIHVPPKSTARLDDPAVQADPPAVPGLVPGSFRELALWTIDDNDKADYSTLNLKAAPLGPDPLAPPGTARTDSANRFSSYTYGDPLTPLPRLYANDPLVVRTINVSNTVDTLHFQGGKTLLEPRYFDHASPGPRSSGSIIDTIHYGVSEKFSLVFNGQQDELRMRPGDYLYSNGLENRTQQGAWGIVRVLPGKVGDLQPLPGVAGPAGGYTVPSRNGAAPPTPTAADTANPCPPTAPVHPMFDVTATDAASSNGKGARTVFVPSADATAVKKGQKAAEPLVLHVAAGECVSVKVTNQRTAPVGFSVAKLDRNAGSGGVNVGFAPDQNIAPNASRTFSYYVPSDHVGTAAIADLAGSGSLKSGMYGAVVVSPTGTAGRPTTFTDPATGATRDIGSQVLVHVDTPGAGVPADYRDFTTVLADDDARMGQDFMPYPTNAATGKSLINYRSAPTGDGPTAFTNPGQAPVLTSYAGDPVVVHALEAAGSENAHVFSLGGLQWPQDLHVDNANWFASMAIGPWESIDAWIVGGAGGPQHGTGDYFFGDLRRPFTQAGMWGLQRVLAPPATSPAASGGTCALRRVDNTC
jgi:hypothetical protein